MQQPAKDDSVILAVERITSQLSTGVLGKLTGELMSRLLDRDRPLTPWRHR